MDTRLLRGQCDRAGFYREPASDAAVAMKLAMCIRAKQTPLHEQRLAALEEGFGGDCFGHAKIHARCMTHLREEVRVLCSRDVWSARVSLFDNRLRKFGVDVNLCFADSGRCVARGGHIKNPASVS